MTQEERTLLHIDLSERIPYDTILKVKGLVTSNDEFGDAYLDTISWYEEVSVRDGSRVSYDIADVRPYLRSLLSMADEEKEELRKAHIKDEQLFADCIINHPEMRGKVIPHFAADWCNKNHVNYRLPEHLFIEITEVNNPYKT